MKKSSPPTTTRVLRVDGVSLGQTRDSVDLLFQNCSRIENPAWGRYRRESSRCSTLVSFVPEWPDTESRGWHVQTVCGEQLCLGDRPLLKVSENESKALSLFGSPDERYPIESGFYCLRFGACLLTLESSGKTIMEIALRGRPKALARPEDRPAPLLLDGALAC